VLDRKLSVRGRVTQEFPQHVPRPGWVEHDLEEIWDSTVSTLRRALSRARVSGRDVAAVGITNQRETVALWSRRSDAPLHRAIVWQDRRTAVDCQRLRDAGREPWIRERTGLVLDPYFSATKLRWMLDHLKGARARAEKGELAFGTIDTFLAWRLTGGKAHVTDPSNASRTMLMDLRTRRWDPELLDLFGVPGAILPEIRMSSEVYGTTKGLRVLPDGVPVAGIAGDQQAALFGQACFRPGDAKVTYGTGAFVLANTGPEPVASGHGLLTTVGWAIPGEVAYALEGSAFIAGAAVQWLRDGLGIIRSASEVEALARSVPDTGGVVFVPALTGLGAPHWRADARGLVAGIDRGTRAGHIARAALEGVALEVHDLVTAMRQESRHPLPAIRVDGGACKNDLLMQMQADLLEVPVIRPKMVETTALGAAFLAGLAVGYWKSRDEIGKAWKVDRKFTPRMTGAARDRMLARWRWALERA
jgi:glycerol kinase